MSEYWVVCGLAVCLSICLSTLLLSCCDVWWLRFLGPEIHRHLYVRVGGRMDMDETGRDSP